MSSIKKMLGLSVVVAVAALGFGASSAFASDAYTCQFLGVAGIASPGVQAVGNDLSINPSNTSDPTGLLDTDSGSFSFNGSATCAHVDTDSGEAANSGVGSVGLSASGTYVNTICGTGTADGTSAVNSTSAIVGNPETPASARFHIQFVAGQGALTISSFSNAQRSGGSGAGEVTIVPVAGNCANADVTSFEVSGAFAATV